MFATLNVAAAMIPTNISTEKLNYTSLITIVEGGLVCACVLIYLLVLQERPIVNFMPSTSPCLFHSMTAEAYAKNASIVQGSWWRWGVVRTAS